MTEITLRIASRKSPLALWQTEYVKQQLLAVNPNLTIELVLLKTEGDQRLDTALSEIGGKGLFMKELEMAILEGRADFAVHSLKDIPYQLPEGFVLASFCQRASALDAFVSNKFHAIDQLPKGAIVGTSSLRRQAQLLHHRNDLIIKPVRGNVNTRLLKLDNNEYDALLLAEAGLNRLELSNRIKQVIPDHLMLPAAGQGIIAIECLDANTQIKQLLSTINHRPTEALALAERSCSEKLQASCHAPVGIYATKEDDNLFLRGIVLSASGEKIVKAESLGHDPIQLGKIVADELLKKGATSLLS